MEESVARPAGTWVAAVHESENDFAPVGAAVVIDQVRVLTCAHVVLVEGRQREQIWVAFPKADDCPRRRVAEVTLVHTPPVRDLAVLRMEEPVPAGVDAARLRCPRPSDLEGGTWSAFGFPERDPIGNSADGQIGTALGYGWVRLDTSSRYLVQPGFSGGGLWSPDYQAVVALVGQAHGNGDGRAITLHQADLSLPGEKITLLAKWTAETAGEAALQQWGWSLAQDPERPRHWGPRARGMSIDSERGYRFRGRTRALTRIREWLDRASPDRRVLVVTGSPGVGKSAVLGRIVTTADAALRAALPPEDGAVRATTGSVDCAVHAKAKTALEVAEEIARAASAELPRETRDLAPAVRAVLADRGGPRFNVIIDALDEASTPQQARAIIRHIVLPLAETCADVGAQVLVGTRRHDDGGDLLSPFGRALDSLDLDDPGYFAEEDLADYALACLQLTGDERPGNPYADTPVARPLADRIAEMSAQNFLVAGLIARTHGIHDTHPADTAQPALAVTVDVDWALATYLQPLGPVGELTADQVLTALAFAEAPGLPITLWQVAIQALYGVQVGTDVLTGFARSAAANFLVEAGTGARLQNALAEPEYRLFHQALNDTLLRARSDRTPRPHDEAEITRAFTRAGRQTSWEDTPGYLLRSLPRHAEAAGLVDELLNDTDYLLHADVQRLLQVADKALTQDGRRRAKLLRLTPQAITATPGERAALFSVTEALDNLGTSYREHHQLAPYRARWAHARPRTERGFLTGHQGWVYSVCAVTIGGKPMLATGGDDETVRIWDPETGQQTTTLHAHQGWVYSVCAVTIGGKPMLATGGADRTVRIWDPETGQQTTTLEGHQGAVNTVCAVTIGGKPMLATGSADRTVRIWDPETGQQTTALEGHQNTVYSVCAVMIGGKPMLATGGDDETVRIWDPETGQQTTALEGHRDWVYSVCAVTIGGKPMLATGGDDRTVRIWDPVDGRMLPMAPCHYPINAITEANGLIVVGLEAGLLAIKVLPTLFQ
jgi:hypothetical protein